MEEPYNMTLADAARLHDTTIERIVEIFFTQGIRVDADPNYQITHNQYQILLQYIDGYHNPGTHKESNLDNQRLERALQEGAFTSSLIKKMIKGDNKEEGASQEPAYLQVDVEIPDHFTDEQVEAFIAELAQKLDDAHRDLGGSGLEVKDLQVQLQGQSQEVLQ